MNNWFRENQSLACNVYYCIHLLGRARNSCIFSFVWHLSDTELLKWKEYTTNFFLFFFTAVFKFILVYNFRPVMESVSHSVCCLQPLSSFFCSFWCFQVLAIAKEKVKQQTEKDAIVILPSILLKSLQFILLFCQGRLQIQIASIMGQLEGAVIRLSMQPHTHT